MHNVNVDTLNQTIANAKHDPSALDGALVGLGLVVQQS